MEKLVKKIVVYIVKKNNVISMEIVRAFQNITEINVLRNAQVVLKMDVMIILEIAMIIIALINFMTRENAIILVGKNVEGRGSAIYLRGNVLIAKEINGVIIVKKIARLDAIRMEELIAVL
jgi:hypothetical protein